MQLTDQQAIDIKPRFITYSFYRQSKDVWEISQTADGWQTANINKQDIMELNTGVQTFQNLNWN